MSIRKSSIGQPDGVSTGARPTHKQVTSSPFSPGILFGPPHRSLWAWAGVVGPPKKTFYDKLYRLNLAAENFR